MVLGCVLLTSSDLIIMQILKNMETQKVIRDLEMADICTFMSTGTF